MTEEYASRMLWKGVSVWIRTTLNPDPAVASELEEAMEHATESSTMREGGRGGEGGKRKGKRSKKGRE